MAFGQGKVDCLIKHFQDMVKLLSMDISISRRHHYLEIAKRMLGKPEVNAEGQV